MSESVGEVAARCGIPEDKVGSVTRDPEVCRLLVDCRDNPDTNPESIMAMYDLPVIDPTGLDVEAIEKALEK